MSDTDKYFFETAKLARGDLWFAYIYRTGVDPEKHPPLKEFHARNDETVTKEAVKWIKEHS